MTQFGRALHALNIDIICANSSQAKGRVERANKTLQDRLVKELRLGRIEHDGRRQRTAPGVHRPITTRALPRSRANTKDLHRPLRAGDDLDDAFAWKEERTVSQALTLQYDKVVFIARAERAQPRAAIRKRVTVVDYPDGRLAIRYNGRRSAPTAPSTSCGRFRPGRDRREQAAGRRPSQDSRPAAELDEPRLAARRRRAAKGRATLACSKSAEAVATEPSAARRSLGRQTAGGFEHPCNRAPVGRCAAPRAPRPPAARPRWRVTFLNGRNL